MPIKLEIRKKNGNVWEYVRLDEDDIVGSSKQHLTTIDDNSDKSVIFTQPYGNNFAEYKLDEVAVYDDSTGGSIEVFTDLPEFQNRLKTLGNPSFFSDDDLVIADLISGDSSNGLVIGNDGKLYVSSSGGGGGSVPSGGLKDEILKKSSNTDYDYEWGANVPIISNDADNIAVIGTDGGLFVPQGIPDSGSANLRYIFASATNPQEPTANTLQINNVDLSLATEIYFSSTAYPNRSVNNILELLKQGDALYLQQSSDDDFFINANITGEAVDNGSFFTIPIEIVTSGEPFNPNSFTDLIVYHSGGGNGNPTSGVNNIVAGTPNVTISDGATTTEKVISVTQTTAGLLSNVYFTADEITTTEGTFYKTLINDKGLTPQPIPTNTITLDDNESGAFPFQFLGDPSPINNPVVEGVYAAFPVIEVNSNQANQRVMIEAYVCDSDGVPLNGGGQIGFLGVETVLIADSGVIDIQQGNPTSINCQGFVDFTQNPNTITEVLVGQRFRYVVIAEKVGTGGNLIDFTLLSGSDYNSYYQIPTISITTGFDPNAIHKDVPNEFDLITEVTEPNNDSFLLIEDELGAKKKVKVGSLVESKLVENLSVSGTYGIDYSFDTWNLVVTGATSFTESNLPLSGTNTKVITLYVQGEFSLTFPTGWSTNIIGDYDGAVRNQIVVEFIKTGDYAVEINQPD